MLIPQFIVNTIFLIEKERVCIRFEGEEGQREGENLMGPDLRLDLTTLRT